MEKDKLTFENLLNYFRNKVDVSNEEWNKMPQKDKMREAANVANEIVSKKESTELMTIKELLIRGYMYCEEVESIRLESPCLTDSEYESLKNLGNTDIESLYYFVKMKMPPSLLRNYDSEVKAVMEFVKESNMIKIK